MQNFIFAVATLLLKATCFAQTWNQLSDFPGTQRDDGTSFVIGNTAYCGTGNLPWGVGTIDFYAFDMNTELWSSIASLPVGEERQYACGFSDDTHGYIFGGYNTGTFFGDLWQYNPLTNTWTERTAIPADARSASACFVIGDTAYLVCGKTASNYAINEVWAYNMSNDSWEQKNNFPFGNRWRSSGASSPTKGYLIFGKDETLSYEESLYEYNPITDSWTLLNTFPLPGRTHSSLQYFNDDLLIVAGYDSLGNSHNDFWKYDIANNNWVQLNSIPAIERRAGMCFHNSLTLYYTTGINANHIRVKETWKNNNPTTIWETNQTSKLEIFPNPAQTFFTIIPTQEFLNGSLNIFDLSGKLILTQEINGLTEIDCSRFNAGIYTVIFANEESSFVNKLVISN